MRALSFVLASCLFLGCATTSRVRDVEQRLDVVEGFLGIQLKRYDDSTWGKKLGGPEASEAVASVGTWVPAQAEKMLLGAGLAGGGGLTYPGTLTLSGVTLTTANGATAIALNDGAKIGPWGGSGQDYITNNGGYVEIGNLYVTNATAFPVVINSSVGSGSNAISFSTNGARLDLGTGSNDYWASDGTYLTTPTGITIGGFSEYQGGVQIDSTLLLQQLQGTAGSGTGITSNCAGCSRSFVDKITVARTALTAAATTQDITIWTVPAKTRIVRIVEDVTAAFDDAAGPISAVVTRCGPAVNSAAYLLDGSVFAVTTLGDVAAEIGAGLLSATVADIPSFSATTAISCRWTSTGGNLSTLTTGSSTFYIEGVVYP